jgi:sarcosine oxidase
MAQAFDTIVVGVGGMGAAVLYHLAKRGQRVLGIEQFEIGHARGSSHGETRAIRKSYFEGSHYVPLVQRAYELWDELSAEAGLKLLHRTGTLEMSEPGIDFFDRARACCLEHGLAHEVLDVAAIIRRFPAFNLAPGTRGLFQPDGGYVLSDAALRAHVDLAQRNGATLHTKETVRDYKITAHGSVEVRTDQREYTAGNLVLAAGPWMGQLVPALAKPLATYKQALAWFAPRAPATFQADAMPVFIHFGSAGEFYGVPVHGASGVKVGGPHYARVLIDPDTADRTPDPNQLDALRGFVQRHLPGAAGPPVTTTGCIYTSTPDEHFVLDRMPDAPQVIVLSPCSGHGYKFAAAIGETVVDMIMVGSTRTDIAPFSLSRFASPWPDV